MMWTLMQDEKLVVVRIKAHAVSNIGVYIDISCCFDRVPSIHQALPS